MTLLSENEGGHAPGLVGAWRGEPGGRVRPIAPQDLDAALADDSGWVWLHVDLVDQRMQGWLTGRCALPIAARAVLDGHDESLVLGHEAGTTHGVVVDLEQDMGRVTTVVGRLHFALTDRLLVTARRHPLAAVDKVRRSFSEGFAPATAYELFEGIVAAFCKNTNLRLKEASGLLDTIEDRIVTERLSDERRSLKEVRRLAVSLHRPVAGMVALFDEEDREGWTLSETAHAVLRRLSLRLERLDREIVTLNDRARLLQEEMAAELADESNRSLRAMAIMSALLLPGTLVVGVFGMNTAGLPFSHGDSGFGWAMALGIAATGLFYWLLRRAGISLRF
ncbi:cobalt transporter [Shinella sp. AETb1-6]|uniref:CorA family divalent cation transporter n=1 Tax=Shinella sumterensis TaxID=1967501 RepID=A0AA50CQY0_9HYPH|nr:CorA family divalent cation transporter [Shinella sumterensis]MDP9588361.1 Mg2+ and Co2+ transporter CorA [Shinella zoogloeoides]MXN50956.1 cobalt transporter [Shinella sp. AETb1-6]WLS00448.1 CorA family divalent cation transporter [Shinella sumterensis]